MSVLSRSGRAYPALLAYIVLLALALRFWGISWGLPLELHPDEYIVARIPERMEKNHTWDPGRYNRPNHVSVYLSFLAQEVISRIIMGESLVESFARDRSMHYIVSRCLVAIQGVLLVLAVYWFLRDESRGAALVSSFLVAVMPPFVEQSRFATPDIPVTLYMCLALCCCKVYLGRPALRPLAAACFCAALAFCEKYPGLLVTAAIGGAVAWEHRSKPQRAILWIGVAAFLYVVFCFLVSPFLFLHCQSVFRAVFVEANDHHRGATGNYFQNLGFYGYRYLLYSGFFLTACGIWGLVRTLRQASPTRVLATFGLFYGLAISALGLHWERWALPIWLSFVMLAGLGISDLFEGLREGASRYRRFAVTAAACLSVLALLNAFSNGVRTTLYYGLPDTRIISQTIMSEYGITRENALTDGWSPLILAHGDSAFREISSGAVRPGQYRFLVLSSYISRWRSHVRKQGEKPNSCTTFYQEAFQLPRLGDFRAIEPPVGSAFGPAVLNPLEPLNLLRNASLIARCLGTHAGTYGGPDILIFHVTETFANDLQYLRDDEPTNGTKK
jgi:4-amino-4-deoxy-L-arabinose transferase-like glycosyltransferase